MLKLIAEREDKNKSNSSVAKRAEDVVTEMVMEVSVHEGESLTQKVAQVIAGVAVRAELEPGRIQVLRQMRTERNHAAAGMYRITFGYELVEEE